MNDITFLARNIVNQLFDLAEVPVAKRQEINDQCDAFVEDLIRSRLDKMKELLVPVSDLFEKMYKMSMEQGRTQAALNASSLAASVNVTMAIAQGIFEYPPGSFPPGKGQDVQRNSEQTSSSFRSYDHPGVCGLCGSVSCRGGCFK